MARKYEERTSKPANDAYTGMLALSFIALLLGSTFLYMQYSQYGDKQPDLYRKAEPGPLAAPEKGPDKQPDETEGDGKDKDAKDKDAKDKDAKDKDEKDKDAKDK
jgi:hypothetical protein